MTLSIRPVRLNKSIYLRVPNDIADLIDIGDQTGVTLGVEQLRDRYLLVYTVQKLITAPQIESHPPRTKSIMSGPGHVRIGE